MTFDDWKSNQDINAWSDKYVAKCSNARLEGLNVIISFDQYLFKAYEANLKSASDIGISSDKYNLSRVNDEGDYRIDNCRFITTAENMRERKYSETQRINHIKFMTGNKFSLGVKKSESERENISKLMKGNTYLKGKSINQGSSNRGAKLSEEQVKSIYLDKSKTIHELMIEYSMSYQAIQSIKNNISWKHVTKELL